MKNTQVIARFNALALVLLIIALATEADAYGLSNVMYTLTGLIWIIAGIYSTIKFWN